LNHAQILLAGVGHATFQKGGGVYLTVNGGESWERILSRENYNFTTSVEFAQSDHNIAYAGGSGDFARSSDGGRTWQSLTRHSGVLWGPINVQIGFPIDFQVDPRNPTRIFVNAYGGGNFLSEDGGETWIPSSTGYTGVEIKDVSVDQKNPAIVYVNGRSGPFISRNGGASWYGINTCEPLIVEGARIVIDPFDSNHIIMTSAHLGAGYNSTDGGRSWITTSNYHGELFAISPDDPWQGFQAITFAPSDINKVYGGIAFEDCVTSNNCGISTIVSVLTSSDGGVTWTRQNDSGLGGLSITDIVVHPINSNIAWASAIGGGIFQTKDGGIHWEKMSQGLLSDQVMALAIDPFEPEILYAATKDNGSFKSEDGGLSWRKSNAGMDPNEPLGA